MLTMLVVSVNSYCTFVGRVHLFLYISCHKFPILHWCQHIVVTHNTWHAYVLTLSAYPVIGIYKPGYKEELWIQLIVPLKFSIFCKVIHILVALYNYENTASLLFQSALQKKKKSMLMGHQHLISANYTDIFQHLQSINGQFVPHFSPQ